MTVDQAAELFALAAPLVSAASKAVMGVYDHGGVAVTLKEDNSPLTEADRRSHDILVAGLQASGLPVLSEEGQSIAYEERRPWQRFWLVDPLDGTKEFISRNGEFTINVALVEATGPVFGIVAVPVSGTVYVGALGVGAFSRVESDGSQMDFQAWTQAARRLSGAAVPKPGSGENLRVVASRSHSNRETDDFIKNHYSAHEHIDIVSAGSSLKFCRVAEGRAHVYPRLGPTMEWDTAAGQALLEAAGGSVRLVANGAPTSELLGYNRRQLRNPYFLALGTPPVAAAMAAGP